MIYGTNHHINGSITGKLAFETTGKVIHLNRSELIEFRQKIKDFIYQDKETIKYKKTLEERKYKQ